MKNHIISFILALTMAAAWASCAEAETYIDMQAIKAIESGGDPFAFNLMTRCYGLYQISEICLEDYNQLNNADYKASDLFDPKTNETIARWYFVRIEGMLLRYSIPVSVTTVIASYNWGIGNVLRWHEKGADLKELPDETRNYLRKYSELAKK